jgi:imidazole glycerol-phosphate synthase subunit HisH
MIVIIDLGMGNLHSVLKAFKRLGVEVIVSSDKGEIEKASKLILPGVGHFREGMAKLKNFGLIDTLNRKVKLKNTPLLGICLGMQLLTKHSEEGDVPGLGYVDANTVKLKSSAKFKVPHVGWNTLNIKKDDTLLDDVSSSDEFYFVHSYCVICNKNEDILSTTTYGRNFASSLSKGNLFGVQFHPEKSHSKGLEILKKFIDKT